MNVCSVECKAECCKRWWITLLPEELEKAIEFSGIPRKEFIGEKCVLFAELFPLSERDQGIVVFNELLPKSIAFRVREGLGFMPDFFLALPFIAFKRVNEKCVFLSEESLCSIYPVKPRQCELFPGLSLDSKKELEEQYDFCLLAKGAKPGIDEEHLKKTRDYFSEVEAGGFSRLWHSLPGNGIVKIHSRLFRVSRKEFLALLGPYA